MHKSEQKFRTIFNESAIPMCYVNNDGRILDFNPKFSQVFKYSKADMKTLEEWWIAAYPNPEYRRWVIDTWQKAILASVEEDTEIEPH